LALIQQALNDVRWRQSDIQGFCEQVSHVLEVVIQEAVAGLQLPAQ